MALQAVSTEDAPEGGNYRGFGLAKVDRSFRTWAARLPSDIDRLAVLARWDTCLTAAPWNGPPTWLHSDLRGDNLIARDGRLVAVIDWEGCTVGDPCSDYLAAWWLFDSDSRRTFRDAVAARPDDWLRAMGWALHMAVLAIPYYAESNPVFVAQARQALGEILGDKGVTLWTDPSIDVRPALPDDAEELHRLVGLLADHVGDRDVYSSTAETFRRYGFGPDRRFDALLAVDADRGVDIDVDGDGPSSRAVGACIYLPDFSTWLARPGVYILDLIVESEQRGRGCRFGLARRGGPAGAQTVGTPTT